MIVDGLGQLSDGQTGPDNREDARGFQWVSLFREEKISINHSFVFLFFKGRLAKTAFNKT
jgi:hypothetical protein